MSIPEVIADGSLLLALPIAAAAGLVSFLSPCVVPLAPGYLAYVAGLTGSDVARVATPARQRLPVGAVAGGSDSGATAAAAAPVGSAGPGSVGIPESAADRRPGGRVAAGALLFVAGFSAVFVSFGLVFGRLGFWLLDNQRVITIGLGLAVVLLGLGFLGLPMVSRAAWWNADRRLHYRPTTGLWGAPVLGVVFGLGWAPCIGPTLAAVQSLAFTEASAARGAVLSAAYCLGLGLPFVLLALGVRWSAGVLSWTRDHAVGIQRFGGALLVGVGLLLVTGLWNDLVIRMQSWIGGFVTVI
jgi:cytochrome c-type biogenesis protein